VRRHEFDGCFNFRDLGGWRTNDDRIVRWGRLFRADSVHLMSERDVACARDELAIRTLIDLRGDLEIEHGGLGALAGVVAARHHAPLTSRPNAGPIDSADAQPSSDRSPDVMVSGYLGILEASADLIVDAVGVIARGGALPALFFCAAGKDRTGVLSAVLLGALGVRDEDIVEDYVLTGESIVRIIQRLGEAPGAPDMYRELPAAQFAPYAETMERVVAAVGSAYGSFADYLVANGLPATTLDALAAALLEPAAAE
jgi:protein-tyrosine phosphatase